MGKVLDCKKQQHRPLVFGQFCELVQDILIHELLFLRGDFAEIVLIGLVDRDMPAARRRLAELIDRKVMQNGEDPAPHAPAPPLVPPATPPPPPPLPHPSPLPPLPPTPPATP